MSSRERVQAERAIENALFVLRCIAYDDQHLVDVGRAIDFYVAGDFKSATILATAMVKGRVANRLSSQSVSAVRSPDELERAFRASNGGD